MIIISHLTKIKPTEHHFVNNELKEIKKYKMRLFDLNTYFCAKFFKGKRLCFQFLIYQFSLENVYYLMR